MAEPHKKITIVRLNSKRKFFSYEKGTNLKSNPLPHFTAIQRKVYYIENQLLTYRRKK